MLYSNSGGGGGGGERGVGEGEIGKGVKKGGREEAGEKKRTGRENQCGNPDKSDKCRIWMMGLWVFAVHFLFCIH